MTWMDMSQIPALNLGSRNEFCWGAFPKGNDGCGDTEIRPFLKRCPDIHQPRLSLPLHNMFLTGETPLVFLIPSDGSCDEKYAHGGDSGHSLELVQPLDPALEFYSR